MALEKIQNVYVDKDAFAEPMKATTYGATTLAEAEAFVVLVRQLGMNDDAAIDIITVLKKNSIVLTFA